MFLTFKNRKLSFLVSVEFSVTEIQERNLNDLYESHIKKKFNLLIQENFRTKLNFSESK